MGTSLSAAATRRWRGESLVLVAAKLVTFLFGIFASTFGGGVQARNIDDGGLGEGDSSSDEVDGSAREKCIPRQRDCTSRLDGGELESSFLPEYFQQNDYYRSESTNCKSATVFARGACWLFQCDWYTFAFVSLTSALWLLVAASIVLTSWSMYKILKSYTKKAERKHEVTRGADGSSVASEVSVNGGGRRQSQDQQLVEAERYTNGNGAMMPVYGDDGGLALGYMQGGGGGGGAYSETSSFESHEHYERRLQRVKRSKADRDRAVANRRSNERAVEKRTPKVKIPRSRRNN